MSKLSNVQKAAALLGSIRSPRKAESSRTNGKLGGRPKKVQPPITYPASVKQLS